MTVCMSVNNMIVIQWHIVMPDSYLGNRSDIFHYNNENN